MTTSCVSQVCLEFVGGGSDKLYIIQVHKTEIAGGTETFEAMCYYGRRGSSLSAASKYKGPSSASAKAAADRVEREKRGKGYTQMTVAPGEPITGMPSTAPVFGGASSTGASPVPTTGRRAVVGILPALAEVLPADKVDEYIANPDYGTQFKYDGERTLVSLRRSVIQATNRKGEVRPLTAGAESELKGLLAKPDFSDERETTLDGELMGDVYVAYDLIMLRDNDMRSYSFEERYSALEALLEEHQGLLAPVAWTLEQKKAMREQAAAEDREGLMHRRLSATYTSGRSSAVLKDKLWATCTCRVLTANQQRSIQLAILDDDGTEGFVGNVTVPANMEVPEPDDLVEVRYLYVGNGGSLYQPVLLRVRTDIDVADRRSDLRAAPPEKRGGALPVLDALAA